MAQASLVFCLNRWPFIVASSRYVRAVNFIFTHTSVMPFIGFLWRFLLGFSGAFFLDCGAYEAPALGFNQVSTSVLSWVALCSSGGLWFFFHGLSAGSPVRSWERLFRNAWWLERELGENFGLFIAGKHDRRSLFLIPLVYQAPLRKTYPVGGFFELGLGYQTRTLV
jgi:hypothetical protein